MRDFKKACKSAFLFGLIICLVFSFIFYKGAVKVKQQDDSAIRRSYAGTIDYLFNGASHLKTGLNPEIVDKKTGSNSYNLSGDALSWQGRYLLLKEEIERNPVKTVVIELSFDTFTRKDKSEYMLYTATRLSNAKERFRILHDGLSIDGISNVINAMTEYGYEVIKSRSKEINYQNYYESYIKGYAKEENNDITIVSDREIADLYNSQPVSEKIRGNSIKYFDKAIELCRVKNIDVIFMVMPISNYLIWKTPNLDDVMNTVQSYCEAFNGKLIDFNLLKSRYTLWNDETSFKNENHLSIEGATIFSETYCEVMDKIDSGEDVSGLFYSSYEEMKEDSPYMQVYKNQQ